MSMSWFARPPTGGPRRVLSGFERFILSAIAGVVALPAALHAGTIPSLSPAAFEIYAIDGSMTAYQYTFGDVSGTTDTTYEEGGGTQFSSASADFTAAGGGSVSVTGFNSSGPLTPPAGAGANIEYYLEEVQTSGLPDDPTVPVKITVTLSTDASGDGSGAYAVVSTNQYGADSCAVPFGTGVCDVAGNNQIVSFDYNATPGEPFYVILNVYGGSNGTSGSFLASADPQAETDPLFADAGDFTLISSPDATSTMSPEPSTSSLLCTGLFVLLGTRIYRRVPEPLCTDKTGSATAREG
jgi:hypothetical protein